MVTREQIAAEALEWAALKTPFHWQASLKGKGCDCKGLILGVARELGLPEANSPFGAIADYKLRVDCKLLVEGLRETFDPVESPGLGDIILLKLDGKPQHLAILAESGDRPRMVHTYNTPGRVNHVVSVPFTAIWRNQMASAWTWRSLNEH